eukprot:7285842-Lingulodinium_polyedra.AAC.1
MEGARRVQTTAEVFSPLHVCSRRIWLQLRCVPESFVAMVPVFAPPQGRQGPLRSAPRCNGRGLICGTLLRFPA